MGRELSMGDGGDREVGEVGDAFALVGGVPGVAGGDEEVALLAAARGLKGGEYAGGSGGGARDGDDVDVWTGHFVGLEEVVSPLKSLGC